MGWFRGVPKPSLGWDARHLEYGKRNAYILLLKWCGEGAVVCGGLGWSGAIEHGSGRFVVVWGGLEVANHPLKCV